MAVMPSMTPITGREVSAAQQERDVVRAQRGAPQLQCHQPIHGRCLSGPSAASIFSYILNECIIEN